MRTIEDIKEKIISVTIEYVKEKINEELFNKRIQFLRTCLYYLEMRPKERFIISEIERLEKQRL